MINSVKLQGIIKNITVRGTDERNIMTATVTQYAGVNPRTGGAVSNAFANIVAFDEKAKAALRAFIDIQENRPEVVIEGRLSYYTTKDGKDVRQQVIVESISAVTK